MVWKEHGKGHTSRRGDRKGVLDARKVGDLQEDANDRECVSWGGVD